jgi:hypothetical protein
VRYVTPGDVAHVADADLLKHIGAENLPADQQAAALQDARWKLGDKFN